MSTPKDQLEPAFPETRWDDATRQDVQWTGMTLRDWFAGQVLSGYTGIPDDRTWGGDPKDKIGIEKWRLQILKADAEYCYKMADAMLKAREE